MTLVNTVFLFWIVTSHIVNGEGLTWTPLVPRNNLSFNGTFSNCVGYDRFSDTLVLFGGAESGFGNAKVAGRRYPIETWIYSLDNNTWSMAHNGSSPSPSGRVYAYFGMLRVNDTSIFVISHGANGDLLTSISDTWVFNMDTFEWREVLPIGDGPGRRDAGFSGTAYIGTNTLYVGGGLISGIFERRIETFKLSFTSPTEAYWDKVHGQTSQYNPLQPHSRCAQGSTVIGNDRLIIHGGCTSVSVGFGGPCPSDDTWIFDGANQEWTELPTRCSPYLDSAMAPIIGTKGKAVLHGGTYRFGPVNSVINPSYTPDDEIFLFDADEKTCTRHKTKAINNTFPTTRATHVLLAISNDTFILYGGVAVEYQTYETDLWMLSGDFEETEEIALNNVWFSYYHLHGLLNGIAFGILLPTGFLIARYMRCRESRIWPIAHITIQVIGVITSLVAFIVIFAGIRIPLPSVHGIIGIILEILLIVQFLNGIFRPRIKKDVEDTTKYRKCWQWFHRVWGIVGLSIGFVEVTLGVLLIIAPTVVWALWFVILGLWIISYVGLEIYKWIQSYTLPVKSVSGKRQDIELVNQ